MHACNGVMDVALAYRADGTVLALSVRDIADEGTNVLTPPQHNLIKLGSIANGYLIPAIRYEAWSVLTSKCPSGANRGIGKPFMCFAVEQAMTLLAGRLGRDPAELRLANYGTATEMQYTTPPGAQYDSGDYPPTLRSALDRFDYAGWRAEQARERAEGGRLLGIGIASSVELAGTNLASYELITGRRGVSGSAEAAMVRLEPDGTVRASIGDPPSGQSYEVIAQMWRTSWGVPPRRGRGGPRVRLRRRRRGSICRATTRTSSPSPPWAPSSAPRGTCATSCSASPRTGWTASAGVPTIEVDRLEHRCRSRRSARRAWARGRDSRTRGGRERRGGRAGAIRRGDPLAPDHAGARVAVDARRIGARPRVVVKVVGARPSETSARRSDVARWTGPAGSGGSRRRDVGRVSRRRTSAASSRRPGRSGSDRLSGDARAGDSRPGRAQYRRDERILRADANARLHAVGHRRRDVVHAVADGEVRQRGDVDRIHAHVRALDREAGRQRHGCRAAESRRRDEHLEVDR
jgi:hypothetical protein